MPAPLRGRGHLPTARPRPRRLRRLVRPPAHRVRNAPNWPPERGPATVGEPAAGTNVYRADGATDISPAIRADPALVYVKTLYVDNDLGNTLTPINPRTGHPGTPVPVADPYNLYFTPDGRFAIVVAERLQRLDFRNPATMHLVHSLSVPACRGVDHMDFSADGPTPTPAVSSAVG